MAKKRPKVGPGGADAVSAEMDALNADYLALARDLAGVLEGLGESLAKETRAKVSLPYTLPPTFIALKPRCLEQISRLVCLSGLEVATKDVRKAGSLCCRTSQSRRSVVKSMGDSRCHRRKRNLILQAGVASVNCQAGG